MSKIDATETYSMQSVIPVPYWADYVFEVRLWSRPRLEVFRRRIRLFSDLFNERTSATMHMLSLCNTHAPHRHVARTTFGN